MVMVIKIGTKRFLGQIVHKKLKVNNPIQNNEWGDSYLIFILERYFV